MLRWSLAFFFDFGHQRFEPALIAALGTNKNPAPPRAGTAMSAAAEVLVGILCLTGVAILFVGLAGSAPLALDFARTINSAHARPVHPQHQKSATSTLYRG